MKQNEPDGNESHVYHYILSRCGGHKISTILLILGLLVLSVCGAYWYFSEDRCEDISLSIAWDSSDVYEIEGIPVVRVYENEIVNLVVTVSTTKPGALNVIAKSELDKPVWLTVWPVATRVDRDAWGKGEIKVYFRPIEEQLQPTSSQVKVRAEKDQDGSAIYKVAVEAFFVNKGYSVTKYAYIDVSKGIYPISTGPMLLEYIYPQDRTYVNKECSDIILELQWASGNPIAEETDPTVEWNENEPIELFLTVGTLRSGIFKVVVNSQELGQVEFSRTKEGAYLPNKLEIVSQNLREPLNPIQNSVWIKSKINPRGFKNGIYVKATLDGDCEKVRHAFLRIHSMQQTSNSIDRMIQWTKQNLNLIIKFASINYEFMEHIQQAREDIISAQSLECEICFHCLGGRFQPPTFPVGNYSVLKGTYPIQVW